MRLKAQKAASFDDFTTLVKALLEADWGCDWGTFTQAFPNGTDPQNIELPIITYQCKKRIPGLVGANTREIRPRLRETLYEENGEADALEVYAQVFDCTVVFDVWHETNAKADEVAERFLEFMMCYSGHMMKMGVQKIVFVELKDTTESFRFSDKAVVRSFEYLVRIEKQVAVPVSTIKEVIGRVNLLVENLVIKDETDSSIDETDSSLFDESLDFKIPKGGN